MSTEKRHDSLQDRIHDELVDSVDEELELEIDDDRLAGLLDHVTDSPEQETIDRSVYFKELLQLQRELVKFQDWVVHQKLKVVVLFEGRDAAGKGGAIKRVTQRLNPRICRTVALPAPTERERTQWYFQRYVAHLPGAGAEAYPVDSGLSRCSMLSDRIGAVARADTDGEGAVARGIPEVVSR
jgi:polyphosphate kinase